MNGSNANKTAIGASGALGFLVIVALLSYHRQSELAGAIAIFTSGLVALLIHREMTARQQAEAELGQVREELEDRVRERTAEINTTNVALQAEVAERQRAEAALQRAHDELEVRVTDRTRELADANHVLQREIVERLQITEALKNSRTLYHSLVEHLPVYVWRTDVAGRLTFVNERFCENLGLPPEEVLGRTFYDFYTTASATKCAQADQYVRLTGEAAEDILEYETHSGRQGFEQVLKTPFHDADGRVLGVQGISWDVTERKRAEEEMRHIQKQLERTNSDLRRKNEEVQNFYHTLSHELKTPLTSAREFVSIVRDGLGGELNETQRDYLGIALESCNQLRVCINDLLDATRLETGKLSMDFKVADLGPVVQRVVLTLCPAALGKQIELTCDVDPDLPALPLDERRISQVVTNLLNNALKFTSSKGRIQVRVGLAADQPDVVEVTVSDTGRGIPPEQCERIFDRLFQVRSGDATIEQGVGLGLYICRELVRLHGGEIVVQSQVGVGSTFTFTLPRQSAQHRPSLLLVDDDPSMRDILRCILEKAEFNVTTAADGQSALQEIQRRVPDVVLMDLEMPGMDGSTALQEIRRTWGAIPVVLHTGHVDGPLLTRALECSPLTVLAKPCPMDQLVQTVRNCEPNANATRILRSPEPMEPAAPAVPPAAPPAGAEPIQEVTEL
jgi:PAS domain S-box-containing protein